ncbi:DUF3077 domain-containing protein [Pseudomonas solani]|uniref:DUF3077 domain-containing protein n=1 Tax=Pseudomonas solani TaxID=2731552 RepID=UPI003C2CDD88
MNAKVKFQPRLAGESIKTVEGGGTSFHYSGDVDKEQFLFSVTPGVEMRDALNTIYLLLTMIEEPLHDAGMGEPLQDNEAWRVKFVFDAAQAGILSLIGALDEEAREAGQTVISMV